MCRRLLLVAALVVTASPLAAQLAITNRAAIGGAYGLEVQTDGTGRSMYAVTTEAALYPSLEVGWSMRVNDLQMALGVEMDVLQLREAQDQTVFAVALREVSPSAFEVVARYLDGGVERSIAPYPVSATSTILVQWGYGTFDGFVRFLVDGALVTEVLAIDSHSPARNLYFGAPAGTTAMQSGFLALDDFRVDSSQPPAGVAVPLEVIADEPGYGDISDYVIWSSNIDGFLGIGRGPFHVKLSDGNHTITAGAVLVSGDVLEDQVTINVVDP